MSALKERGVGFGQRVNQHRGSVLTSGGVRKTLTENGTVLRSKSMCLYREMSNVLTHDATGYGVAG